jgi:hypothetical protein
MNVTATKLSGEEIHKKYPITNTKWRYSNREYDWNDNNGYYYSNYKDWSTEIVTDPWRRNIINNGNPINTTEERSMFSTTVEGNKIILIIYLKTYV